MPAPSRPPAPGPARPLVRVPVPPGAAGVEALLRPLAAALDGSGPAVAPVPVVSAAISQEYVAAVLAAVRPDDPGLPLESADVAVVLSTSGSTGDPRGVLLTADQLTCHLPAIQGGSTPQWIAALPVTSMGGLNVVVRALAAGRAPLALPSLAGAEPFTPASFAAAVRMAAARSADVRTSLVPAQVARLLADEAGIDALAACTSILVGGGPLRPSLRAMAADLGIGLTATYGATETAGGCVLDGRPLPGVQVAVLDPDHDGAGRLAVTGPCVASGYRGDAPGAGSALSGGVFTSSDLGRVDRDGTVHVLGRIDDVVIVGGVNVSPGAVERVLDDHPDVVSAAVAVDRSGAGEPRLVAFVEPRDGARDLAGALTGAVVERLGRAARPVEVRTVGRLPHLPNGKVDRRLLEQWATGGEA